MVNFFHFSTITITEKERGELIDQTQHNMDMDSDGGVRQTNLQIQIQRVPAKKEGGHRRCMLRLCSKEKEVQLSSKLSHLRRLVVDRLASR